MNNTVDTLIDNVNLTTFTDNGQPYGQVNNASVAINNGKIVSIGSAGEAPCKQAPRHRIDANGRWLTPGLIDCHTHLVHAGSRAQEFEWRLQGDSYESIAQRGGGILSTVRATRAASEQQLFDESAPRLQRLIEEGVTTVEIKSGYGLDLDSELKMLRVARKLESAYPVTVKTTFLGAHAIAPEYRDQSDGGQAYIDHLCKHMLPAIADSGLADAVDVFCEGIGFSPSQCEQVFEAAQVAQLPIKAHVEQLSNLEGAVLAANYNALSVDHIEYLQAKDVARLNTTVAVLLPAAFYCLNETQKPPINALREHNIAMAVATDLNPGTAPVASLLTAVNQACVLFGLTPEESLRGATRQAARALGIDSVGQIEVGMDADLALWSINHPSELAYGINLHRPHAVWKTGQLTSPLNG